MSIRLDWQIEEERQRFDSSGEDPEARRARRRTRRRFVLLLLTLAAVVGGALVAVDARLRYLDDQVDRRLRETVAAEVTALRLGDLNAFMSLQRSDSQEWLRGQEQVFAEYQRLKQTQPVVLSGRVVETTIDGTRGRVVVEEIVADVPYGRAWFYWRFEDGWRRVPNDYTFWGDEMTITDDRLTVRHRDFDTPAAQAIASIVGEWLTTACAIAPCDDAPLTIDLVVDLGATVAWAVDDPRRLIVPSPYLRGMRLDQPFWGDARRFSALLIAEQVVAGIDVAYPSDAYYLRTALRAYLTGRFAEIDAGSHLLVSLQRLGGDEALTRLFATLPANGGINSLSAALGVPIDRLDLDWRDFVGWRLEVENALIAADDSPAVRTLYAPQAQPLAESRLGARQRTAFDAVLSVVRDAAADGTPVLRATIRTGTEDRIITFVLSDGIWRRAD